MDWDLIGSLGGVRYSANNQQDHTVDNQDHSRNKFCNNVHNKFHNNVHNQDLSHNKFCVPPVLLHDCPIEGEKE